MCPLSNILVETEVVLEVIPQQLHPILFHLISIMAMVHRYILVVSKFPEQKKARENKNKNLKSHIHTTYNLFRL